MAISTVLGTMIFLLVAVSVFAIFATVISTSLNANQANQASVSQQVSRGKELAQVAGSLGKVTVQNTGSASILVMKSFGVLANGSFFVYQFPTPFSISTLNSTSINLFPTLNDTQLSQLTQTGVITSLGNVFYTNAVGSNPSLVGGSLTFAPKSFEFFNVVGGNNIQPPYLGDGYLLGGYSLYLPANGGGFAYAGGIPKNAPVIFQLPFQNVDPKGRNITLSQYSAITLGGTTWYIVGSVIAASNDLSGCRTGPYTCGVSYLPYTNPITIPYGKNATLDFGAKSPCLNLTQTNGCGTQALSSNPPTTITLLAVGSYNDGTLFAGTVNSGFAYFNSAAACALTQFSASKLTCSVNVPFAAQGPYGTTISLGYTGFSSNEPVVYWFNKNGTTSNLDTTSTFNPCTTASGFAGLDCGTVTFQIPPHAQPGFYQFAVSDQVLSYVYGTVQVTVPSITLSPGGGPVGTSVTVTGMNFVPSSSVTITFDGSPVKTTTATSSGALPSGVTFLVPTGSTLGPHTVAATDSFGNSATEVMSVSLASLSLSFSSGPAGSLTTISGSGYASGVQYSYCLSTSSTSTASCISGTTGSFTGQADGTIQSGKTLLVPSGTAVGSDFVLTCSGVACPGGNLLSSASFTVTAASLGLTPDSGPPGTAITFSGGGYAPSTQYYACLSTSPPSVASCIGSANPPFKTDGSGQIVPGTGITAPATPAGSDYVLVYQTNTSPIVFSAHFTVTSSITLSPDTDPTGSVVTVTGAGFAATKQVTLTFDGNALSSNCNTDATGAIKAGCTFVVPTSGAGSHKIVATDASAAKNTASEAFEVVYTITLTPSSGPVGSVVSVKGTSFASASTMTITDDGTTQTTTPSPCTTDSTGSFSCSFTVPGSVGGPHTVNATDAASNSVLETFTVAAFIALSPASGPPGQTVTVTGNGFAASLNGGVAITFSGVSGNQASCSTDSSGNMLPGCTFVIPASAVGLHTVTASDGTNTATATINVQATPTISTALSTTTINKVQQVIGTSKTSTSFTCSFSSQPAVGDFIVVSFTVTPSTLTVSSVSDAQSHSLTLVETVKASSNPTVEASMWAETVTNAASSPITITLSGAPTSAIVTCVEWTGVSSVIGGVGFGSGTSTSSSFTVSLPSSGSGSLTPTTGDLVYAYTGLTFCVSSNSGNNPAVTSSSPFTAGSATISGSGSSPDTGTPCTGSHNYKMNDGDQYDSSWTSGSTTAAFTACGSGSSSCTSPTSGSSGWVEIVADFNAVSLNPLTAGQSVHFSATLSSATSNAGGTVQYEYFSNPDCSSAATNVGTPVTVTNAVVPNSIAQAFSTEGLYGWEAVYSGDANNVGTTSACELLTVQGFSVSSSVTSASVWVGTSLTPLPTITVTSLDGFAGTVALSASVSPASGLTASLNPTSVVLGTSQTSTLTLTGTVPGNYTVTVSGTSGSLIRTATVTVSVTGVTQPILVATPSGGTAFTYTVSGCSVSPTSGTSGPSATSFTATYSCTITVTMPAAGSNTRYVFASSASSTTTTTCSSGTCATFQPNDYYQLQNTYKASPTSNGNKWDAALSIPVTGTIAGVAGQTGCTIATTSGGGAVQCSGWFDYNTVVTVTSPLTVSSTEQWAAKAPNTFTQTTGGNTNNVNYVQQFFNTYKATAAGLQSTFTSVLTWPITGTQAGVAAQTTCTITSNIGDASDSCSGWSDGGTAASFPSSASGSPASTRLQASGTTSFTDTSAGNTHSVNYYMQLQITYQVTANAQTNFDTGMSWAITGTIGGTGSSTGCTISSTAASTDSCQAYFDYGTLVTFPANPTGAPTNTRWQVSGASSFTDTNGGGTHPVNYFKQLSEKFAYSLTGGGSFTAPTLYFTALGVPSTTYTMTLTLATQWLDAGTSWSSTNPLGGSTGTQRAQASSAFGTASAGSSVTIAYYNQYLYTLSYSIADGGSGYSAPTLTTTQFGGSYTPALTTGATGYWLDNSAACSVTNPLSGSGSSERWDTATACPTVSSSQTVVFAYYNQFALAYSYSISGGGSPTAPGLSCTQFGSAYSPTLTTSAATYWCDNSQAWSVSPNPLTGSSERWQAGTSQTLSGTVSATLTTVFTFYNQYSFTLSYSVSGGGSGYSAPILTAKQFGSAYAPALTGSATAYWLDSGQPWSVTNPLGGSGSTEEWYSSQTVSGTVSSSSPTTAGGSLIFTFANQYKPTFVASPMGGGTMTVGGTTTPSGTSVWENAGSLSISATANSGYTFSSWGSSTGSITFTSSTSSSTTATISGSGTITANFVLKSSPTIATTLSATTITAGSSAYDTATLSGMTSNAGGTVQYEYFSGGSCSGTATNVGSAVTVTNGAVPSSQSQTFSSGGSYGWEAVYSGDSNNNGATSSCESLTVKASPTIATTLSATTIIAGQSASDTATLSGATSTAGGTVSYYYYTNGACSTGQALVSTVTVTSGSVPNSASHTFSSAGSYSWNAVYSGDTNNNGATSACESLTVTSKAQDPNANSHAFNTASASPVTVTISTTDSNDLVYACEYAVSRSATLNTPTATGLTFSSRASSTGTYSTNGALSCWTATASGTLTSTVITFTSSASSGVVVAVTAFNVPTPVVFDGSAVISFGSSGTASATDTTSNANDVIFSFVGVAGSNTITTTSGYTVLNNVPSSNGASGADEYQIVSTTGSYTPSFTFSSNHWGVIVDAIDPPTSSANSGAPMAGHSSSSPDNIIPAASVALITASALAVAWELARVGFISPTRLLPRGLESQRFFARRKVEDARLQLHRP